MASYIKIDRKILDWEWYGDINTCRLFFHMLLRANWKDGRFQGIDVPRGAFISSIRKLAEETGLTEREIRTAILHLKTTGEVTSKSHAKYTVFTIKNYCLYQANDTQNAKQETSERQANDNNRRKEEEKEKDIKDPFVPTPAELPEPPKVKYSEDSFEMHCVNSLVQSILGQFQGARNIPRTLEDKQKWCVEIDRMKRLDKRTEGEVLEALDYVLTDSFWSKNILSTGKFRKQFDQLIIKARARKKREKPKNGFHNLEEHGYDYDKMVWNMIAGQEDTGENEKS